MYFTITNTNITNIYISMFTVLTKNNRSNPLDLSTKKTYPIIFIK
jgi:hypothetical protein